MKTERLLPALILGLGFAFSNASAQPNASLLGTAAPPVNLGVFEMVPFDVIGLPGGGILAPSVAVPSGATPVGSVNFSVDLFQYKVDPTDWKTWSNGYAGDVYLHDVSSSFPPLDPSEPPVVTTLTLTLPVNTKAFYFYLEPTLKDLTASFNITGNGAGGSATIANELISGDGGAKGYGFWVGDPTKSLTSVSISTTIGYEPDDWGVWPDGYAVGQFGINGTPTQGVPDGGTTGLMMVSALFALALWVKRRGV